MQNIQLPPKLTMQFHLIPHVNRNPANRDFLSFLNENQIMENADDVHCRKHCTNKVEVREVRDLTYLRLFTLVKMTPKKGYIPRLWNQQTLDLPPTNFTSENGGGKAARQQPNSSTEEILNLPNWKGHIQLRRRVESKIEKFMKQKRPKINFVG